tara:strand:- start:567 stop:1832 length:1266 start_codon:yes stop_codon:yes gene_type:complete
MSHGITIEDTVITREIDERAWHLLDHQVREIFPTLEKAKQDPESYILHSRILHDILEGDAFALVNPERYKELINKAELENGLNIEDLRELNSLFVECEDNKILTTQLESGIHAPIGTPSKSYCPITNEELLESIDSNLNGLYDYDIITMGTTQGRKRFFATLKINGADESTINGDMYKNYINVMQSSNGSISAQAHDSAIRVVCDNTIKASMANKGDLYLKLRKTKGAKGRLDQFGKTVATLISGRDLFQTMLKEFASVECDKLKAAKLFASWKGLEVGDELSSRSFNQILAVQELAENGKGQNSCTTLYDLFNGVTEFYTSGDGSGRTRALKQNATQEERLDNERKKWNKFHSSEFGTGADQKVKFTSWLHKVLNDNELEAEAEKGRLLLSNKMEFNKQKANNKLNKAQAVDNLEEALKA